MSSRDIVRGYWTDYGQSPFLRARLTLTTNETNLLLIALAVLTALTGEYLWQILCQLLFLVRTAKYRALDAVLTSTTATCDVRAKRRTISPNTAVVAE